MGGAGRDAAEADAQWADLNRILLRGQAWRVRNQVQLGARTRFQLEDPESGDSIEVLCPPDEYVPLTEPAPSLDKRSQIPFGIWQSLHDARRMQTPPAGSYAAFVAGRISPEPYQFAPLARLLASPRRSLLIADDVGLGKTIEAGICLLELIARGVGSRILVVVPPGLIGQWLDEMNSKFGLEFRPIENSAALDRAQTDLSEGLQPWAYFDRVITSTEYLKRREVHPVALARPWDVIVVDEAHYLAESGTPANPYTTGRTRLGPRLRESSRALILLTATPHNGYRHSFRSLLELVEPAEATLHGRSESVQGRVARTMIRRLKPQIVKTAPDGTAVPAFPRRHPVRRIEVTGLSAEEREIFKLVTEYCAKTIKAASTSEEADLVSFAMQIVKKRMLSSRAALRQTVQNRLAALTGRTSEEPPPRSELRELQSDLPLSESQTERTALRILRSAITPDTRRRQSERRQLKVVESLLDRTASRPDPKISELILDLERNVLSVPGEKAIVFTEYRDTLAALRTAFSAHTQLRDAFVELTGGLTAAQRRRRIAAFHMPQCRALLATDAASEGLNLQEKCCRLYHFELPWNPNRLEQRNGRVDRHGQTRNPVISYLFYPDSPEDRVLDKLIQRIATMHDDRVSTPDILGLVEGARIEDVLGAIESAEDGEAKGVSLMRMFDARQEEMAYQLAPLIIAGARDESPFPYANAVSADPSMGDDDEFEDFMRDLLGPALRAGPLPDTWRFDVPRHLQGPKVEPRYDCVTFRRSVAARYPGTEVDFIHRLHPLSRAIGEHALRDLTLEPARNVLASRIAVVRHAAAVRMPFAVFTFLERQSHPAGIVFGIAVTATGEVHERLAAEDVLREQAGPAGDVPWTDCEKVFAKDFGALQATAAKAAAARLREQAEGLRSERKKVANLLQEEASLYKVDRLAEIDVEESTERAGPRDQLELFRGAATNWQARRAAVETNYRRRIDEIERFRVVPEPPEPQALGVLLVFPPA